MCTVGKIKNKENHWSIKRDNNKYPSKMRSFTVLNLSFQKRSSRMSKLPIWVLLIPPFSNSNMPASNKFYPSNNYNNRSPTPKQQSLLKINPGNMLSNSSVLTSKRSSNHTTSQINCLFKHCSRGSTWSKSMMAINFIFVNITTLLLTKVISINEENGQSDTKEECTLPLGQVLLSLMS